MDALIIIDVQNDFMKHGALEVPKANDILPIINDIQDKFQLVVATQDWHPQNHMSFASNHKHRKPFDQILLNNKTQTLWPDHCVQGSHGAQLHEELHTELIEAIFRKGMNPKIDSYSAFYDIDHQNKTGLSGYLLDKQIDRLYFCGLAADICVAFSLQDALSAGFHCSLIEDATKPLDALKYEQVKQELTLKGVVFTQSNWL